MRLINFAHGSKKANVQQLVSYVYSWHIRTKVREDNETEKQRDDHRQTQLAFSDNHLYHLQTNIHFNLNHTHPQQTNCISIINTKRLEKKRFTYTKIFWSNRLPKYPKDRDSSPSPELFKCYLKTLLFASY